jgi:hypothetical protein
MTGDRDFLRALLEDPAPVPTLPRFRFGVRPDSLKTVRDVCSATTAAGVPIVQPLSEPDAVASFRRADPDGYAIELFCQAV